MISRAPQVGFMGYDSDTLLAVRESYREVSGMVHKMRITDIKMFYLPAELAKEAGKKVLSH